MSQFYASIQGNRGMATRMGNKTSGMDSHTRGWNIGIRVRCSYDKENDRDIIRVYKTGGSNSSWSEELIATLTDKEI